MDYAIKSYRTSQYKLPLEKRGKQYIRAALRSLKIHKRSTWQLLALTFNENEAPSLLTDLCLNGNPTENKCLRLSPLAAVTTPLLRHHTAQRENLSLPLFFFLLRKQDKKMKENINVTATSLSVEHRELHCKHSKASNSAAKQPRSYFVQQKDITPAYRKKGQNSVFNT